MLNTLLVLKTPDAENIPLSFKVSSSLHDLSFSLQISCRVGNTLHQPTTTSLPDRSSIRTVLHSCHTLYLDNTHSSADVINGLDDNCNSIYCAELSIVASTLKLAWNHQSLP
ncbi:hypothetical protein FRC03_008538 [Tulasnella sp. 419]|nr:hypothetical protein FRC03_008538 [Tulasnella sp. 419]